MHDESPHQHSLAARAVRGAVAGFTATVPMTVTMEALHRRLPPRQRYPLPPRLITRRVARRLGLWQRLDEPGQRTAATMAAHFGYGSATGMLFAAAAPELRVPPVAAGIGYGLLVWAGSYLGLLPALGVLSPATEHPARRNLLMIIAHVVWGATLGAVVAWLGRH